MGKFSNEVIMLAQQSEAKYGVPASVTLAQYALESGYGTSNLAVNKNNYFGMKAGGSGWQSFDSMAASFDAHGALLARPLYAEKTAGTTNVYEYISAIAETYAPSSDGNVGYVDKIMKIINDNNLTQYDGDQWQNFTYTGSGSSGAVTQTGVGSSVANKIITPVLKFLAILGLGLLAVVFLMSAFTGEQPAAATKKTYSKGKKAAEAVKAITKKDPGAAVEVVE